MKSVTYFRLALALAVGSLSGCKGIAVSPEAEVRAVMAQWREATLAGDIEGHLSILAEDFTNSRGETKEIKRVIIEQSAKISNGHCQSLGRR
jgi:hypothetical protein